MQNATELDLDPDAVRIELQLDHPATEEECAYYAASRRGELAQSPIEALFYREAEAVSSTHLFWRHPLFQQYPVPPYRIDVACPAVRLAVELDGHEYHKTKEQRTADARRERALLSNGWTVMRFTGTEVFTNVAACVDEVVRYAHRLAIFQSRARENARIAATARGLATTHT